MRAVEMENSRRSAGLDRMPEPGSKKPRLDDSSLNLNLNRERTQFTGVRGGGIVGGSTPAYTPSSVPAYEPTSSGNSGNSELVGQYKAALAELTFNSKPIITNLTIIAGENLHAAKSIAYTICANILEVIPFHYLFLCLKIDNDLPVSSAVFVFLFSTLSG